MVVTWWWQCGENGECVVNGRKVRGILLGSLQCVNRAMVLTVAADTHLYQFNPFNPSKISPLKRVLTKLERGSTNPAAEWRWRQVQITWAFTIDVNTGCCALASEKKWNKSNPKSKWKVASDAKGWPDILLCKNWSLFTSFSFYSLWKRKTKSEQKVT